MIRLIFHIILLGIIAAFVAFNVSYTTTVNLFSAKYSDVSTATVVLLAFIAGILYSFVLYLLHYFRNTGRKKLREKKEQYKNKEKELKEKESEMSKQSAATSKESPSTAADASVPAVSERKKSGGSSGGLFKKRKKRATKDS